MTDVVKTRAFVSTILIVIILACPYYGDAQASIWTTRSDGWVYRQTESREPERFFTIGVWGVPGYEFEKLENGPFEDTQLRENLFQSETAAFNTVYVNNIDERRTHFKNKVIVSGWSEVLFRLRQLNYPAKGIYAGQDVTFEEMMALRKDEIFYKNNLLQDVVDNVSASFEPANYDLLWMLGDEVDKTSAEMGSGSLWTWGPDLVRWYKEKAIEKRSNSITILDLFGSINGNLFFFEKFNTSQMAPTTNVADYWRFSKTYKNTDGSLSGSPLSDNDYFNNVLQTTIGYYNSAHIMGVNSYEIFNTAPHRAGLTTRAMRSACPTTGPCQIKPAWVFLSANMKDSQLMVPSNSTAFHKNRKGQAYSAIINGATGVFFYSDNTETGSNTSIYWQKIKELAQELQSNVVIFKGETEHVNVSNGDIEFVIKSIRQERTCERWVIAYNKSSQSKTFTYPGFASKTILAGDVYVAKEDFSAAPGGTKVIGLFSNGTHSSNVGFVDKCGQPVTTPNAAALLLRSQSELAASNVRHVASGDFDGDGIDDLIMLYEQSDLQLKWIVLKSDGAGRFTDRVKRNEENYIPFNIPLDATWLMHSKSVFDLNKIAHMSVGDFNRDRLDDIIFLYKESDINHRIIVLFSNGSTFVTSKGTTVGSSSFLNDASWIVKPRSVFDINAVTFFGTGNFDNNSSDVPKFKDDVVILYKQGIDQQKVLIVHTNGAADGFVDRYGRIDNVDGFVMPLDAYWLKVHSSIFNLDQVKAAATGNLNGGTDDLVMLYYDTRTSTPRSKIIVLHSVDKSFQDRWNRTAPTITLPNEADWITKSPSAFDLNYVSNIAVGNVDGRNYDDLIIQYRQSPEQHKTLVLQTNAEGNGFTDRFERTEPTINIPLDCAWITNHSSDFNVSDVKWLMTSKLNQDNISDLMLIAIKTPIFLQSQLDPELLFGRTDLESKPFAYPNPAETEITISFPTPGVYDMELKDVNGRRILSATTNTSSAIINLADLGRGLYILTIKEKGRLYNIKIVKGPTSN